jgi:hypothetical protein
VSGEKKEFKWLDMEAQLLVELEYQSMRGEIRFTLHTIDWPKDPKLTENGTSYNHAPLLALLL